MARRRRNRRRSFAARLKRQYQNRSKLVDEILREEGYRAKQSEYMTVVHLKQKEVAETTVFVTHVLDTRNPSNVLGLRDFLVRNYGPVVFCRKHHYGRKKKNRFPPALVRFRHASDEASLFGQASLLLVDKTVKILCPVGHGGYILVHRYGHVDEIVQEELTGSIISMSTEGVSFGHWYPPQANESKDQDVG